MDKILIVDDEKLILTVATNILKNHYEVICAESAAEGIRLYEEKQPDLVLTDLNMPVMSGLKMMEELSRRTEMQIPVIYMTGDDDATAETEVFNQGAEDFIRKPFRADVLLHRIEKVLTNRERIKELTKESSTDGLTGFLNKTHVERKLAETCRYETGVLAILDMDDFKLVNDIYGHETGDQIIVAFAKFLKEHTRGTDIVGRVGGDEFLVFFTGVTNEDAVDSVIWRINQQLSKAAADILGAEANLPLGVSAGAIMVPKYGTDYPDLLQKADRALYYSKQNGKHSCTLYSEDGAIDFSAAGIEDLKKLSMILGERNIANRALWLGQNAFGYIYRYMIRYMHRYQNTAYKVLFTIVFMSPDIDRSEFSQITEHLGNILRNTLRNSDIMMQSAPNQFFLLLPGVGESDIQKVIDRTVSAWDDSVYHEQAQIFYEYEMIDSEKEMDEEERASMRPAPPKISRVVVVEEDPADLRLAKETLSAAGMEVTSLSSGQELLDFTSENRPDVILLSIRLSGMDGIEALKRLRKAEEEVKALEVPVVLIAGDAAEEQQTAVMGLSVTDYIRRPLIPEILTLRIRHAIDLFRGTTGRR
ncbi:MAG: response regulator [Lachnospiraceae bacterium]|nr:response regulator [Lachnospiraceae bacterium]